MSDVANIVGKVSADTTQAVRSMDALKKSADGVGAGFAAFEAKAAKAVDAVAAGFKKANDALQGFTSVLGSIKAAYDAVDQSLNMAVQSRQLELLRTKMPTGAMDGLKRATQGVVSEMELAQLATKGLTGDFALTTKQLETTLAAAQALAQQGIGSFNENATKMLDALAKGVNKLDDLGISLEKSGDRQRDVNAAMEKFRAIAADAGPMDEQLRQLMEARSAWKDLGNEITIASGKVVKFFASGPEVADYARHRGDPRMNISESATSAKNWAYVNAFKDSVTERASAQFEAAMRNKPAGWYNELSGKLYLSTNAFGRDVERAYEKATTKKSGGYEANSAQAVGETQTYGNEFFDKAMGATYSDGPQQRVLSEGEFNNALIQKDARDTLAKLKAAGLPELASDLMGASKQIAADVKMSEQLGEEQAALETYAQAGNLAASAMWNFGDALLHGHGGVGALMKELSKGLSGIGKDAAVKALYMLGEGWAFPKRRGESWAAAKFYALTAAAAIPAAAALGALGSSAGGGGGESSSSSSSPGASFGSTVAVGSERDSGGVVINVQGNLYGDPMAFGRAVNDALESASRAGRTRIRPDRNH